MGELFTGLGYLTGLAVLLWAGRERKLLTEGMATVALWAIVGAALGAKLGEWAFNGLLFKVPLAILNPANGGKALLGGVLGGWIAAEIAKRALGIKRSVGDLFALALPAGESVGRIGCYYNRCCYGIPTDGPFRVYQHGAWRHPAQIYSALIAAAMFAILLSIRGKLAREGDLFRIYLVLFGITRFGMEFIREQTGTIYGLSAMQWFCMEIAVMGAIPLYLHSRKPQVGFDHR